ncbi:MAG TPA: uroporphyrinogen decarboxylase family protein [Chloroflexia bacterium]|nr:uroporphyrinogen decarboxylase family protein [Chloroflexia bacterium]
MTTMSKKARVDAALRNEAVDRVPVSLWRHFYESEETAEGLAGAMLAWQAKYDWDWMKVNPRASYHVEGWGVKLRFSGQPLVKPVVTDVPIQSTADWAKLGPLALDSGPLAEQLEVMERLCEALGGKVYALETVFTPLSIAGDLVRDGQQLVDDLTRDPQAVHGALEVITATFVAFVGRLLQAGADGIFFATTEWASRDMLTEEQYTEFGRPYDLRVLAAAQDAGFNILHVCKNNNHLLSLLDYPVHAVNWAVGSPGNPGLREVQTQTDKALIGGLTNETLREGDPAHINAEARAADLQTGGRHWILGPACSIAVDTPDANVRAARDIANQLGAGPPESGDLDRRGQ